MKRRCLKYLISVLPLALFANILAASPVLLWDRSEDPNVVGYKVYFGAQPRSYSTNTDVGLQTSNTLSNLRQGATHYMAVTAYTADGVESAFSEEVYYTPPIDGITSVALTNSIRLTNSLPQISFRIKTGQNIRVVSSDNFAAWRDIFTFNAGATRTYRFTDTNSVGKPLRFYKVIATPP